MKKLKLISLLAIIVFVMSLFTAGPVLAADSDEIEFIKNGGFEALNSEGKPENWTFNSSINFGEHAAISTDVKTDGAQSLQFKGNLTSSAGKAIYQTVTGLASNETYTFSVKYRMDSKTGTGNAARINVYLKDANGATLSTITENIKTLDGVWHTFTKAIETPENMTQIQIYLRVYGDAIGYYDSVSLKGKVKPQVCKVFEPLPGETNMLKNGDFEKLDSDGKPQDWTINDSVFNKKVFVVQDPERGNVLHYKSSDTSTTLAYQMVNAYKYIQPHFDLGCTYQVSAWLKTVDIPATGIRKGPSIQVDMYEDEYVNAARLSSEHAYNFTPTYGTWQKVAYQFTIPEGIQDIAFYPVLMGKGELYYDDVQVYKVAERPVASIETTHVFYTEWEKGVINLDYNYTIPSGSNYNIKIKKDGEEILSDIVPVTQAHQEYTFDINLLAKYGEEYILEVNCTNSSGTVVWSETKDIYRFNRPASLTQDKYPLDGNGNAFYPALGYTLYYEDIELMKEVGINVTSGGVSKDSSTLRVGPNPADRAFTKQWLDTMWENGIMTMVCLYNNNGKFASDAYISNVIDFIEDLGDHPGLLGYLVQDEPFNDWDVEQTTENLKKVYLAIRRVDDKHIVAHVANRERFWDICTDWSDLIICDRYPTETYFRNLQYNFIHHASAASDGKKPVWTLYQTSQMGGGYERTAAKHRNMIYQGMFAGGNSIGYIAVSARDSAGTGITSVQEVYEAAKDIIATGELDDAVKAFISGEYKTFCENSGDKALLSHFGYYLTYKVPEKYWYKAYVKNGELYLLVLNHENADTAVQIPLTSTDKSVTVTNFSASVVDSASSKQTVTGTDGVFKATIEPYGATLFKITTDTDLSSFESTVENPKVNAPSTYVGEATTISWDSVLNAEKYHISICNKATGEEIYSGFTGTNSSYTTTLPLGQYRANVSAYDSAGNYSTSYAEFAVLDTDLHTESAVVKSGNTFAVTTTVHNVLQQCRIIVVGYKNGAVVDIESRYYAHENETFTLEGDIDEIRVMTWNGLLGLVPVCDTEILPASEWIMQ